MSLLGYLGSWLMQSSLSGFLGYVRLDTPSVGLVPGVITCRLTIFCSFTSMEWSLYDSFFGEDKLVNIMALVCKWYIFVPQHICHCDWWRGQPLGRGCSCLCLPPFNYNHWGEELSCQCLLCYDAKHWGKAFLPFVNYHFLHCPLQGLDPCMTRLNQLVQFCNWNHPGLLFRMGVRSVSRQGQRQGHDVGQGHR